MDAPSASSGVVYRECMGEGGEEGEGLVEDRGEREREREGERVRETIKEQM